MIAGREEEGGRQKLILEDGDLSFGSLEAMDPYENRIRWLKW